MKNLMFILITKADTYLFTCVDDHDDHFKKPTGPHIGLVRNCTRLLKYFSSGRIDSPKVQSQSLTDLLDNPVLRIICIVHSSLVLALPGKILANFVVMLDCGPLAITR